MHMRQGSYQRRRRMFFHFMCFLLVLSLSILLMPIGSSAKEKSMIPLIITGLLFWVGLVGTICTSVRIHRSRRASPIFSELYPNQRQFGLIHFFQNKPAIIADVSLLLSLVMFIIVKLLTDIQVFQFITLALIVFTFGMHCMLNGMNYIYITYQIRNQSKY